MAGRPRTMIKKVAALEERAQQAMEDLREIWPEQYQLLEGHENVDDDSLCFWWNKSFDNALRAYVCLTNLRSQLVRKLEEPERERLTERGLLTEEEPETVST